MAEQDDSPETPSVVEMAHKFYRLSKSHTSEWREEAKEMFDMVAGRQWSTTDMEAMEDQHRAPTVFNRIARTLNAIIGTQVSNRQEVRYLPRELGDVQVNEVYTSAAEWARQECDAEDEESDAFEDCCITGMGWTDTRMEYDTDPEGMAKIDRIDPLQMYWDPSATKRNLADSKWMLQIKPMDLMEFERRFPGAELATLSDPWDGDETNESNQREHVYPQDAYNKQQANSRSKGKIIRVGRLQWAEQEAVYRVGKDAEAIKSADFKKIKKRLDENKIKYVKQMQTRWKQAFIAGGQLLDDVEDCPYPDGPTLKAITYKRDRNKNLWYGIVRAMVDPQKFGNKFFSQILDILNKGAKGGVMAEKDAVDNPKEIEEKWARPDGIVWFRPGAISAGKVMPKPVVNLPAGLDRLMTFALDGVHEITGINLELLGMANRDQPGVLEHQRKQAGVTIIAPLFDGLRRYRKEQGRVLLYFIDNYLSDGRLIRIVGKSQEQYVPLHKMPGTTKYDVIVDEAPTSPNMKERVFGALSELLPNIAKMGIPIPPEVLDYTPLPSSLTAKWKQLIEQTKGNPQQLQQQMQQMQEEMQKLQEQNAQLKDKRDQAALQMQIDQQKNAADIELQKQQMAMDWEKAQAEIAIDRQKLDLEREKAGVQLQLQQEKTNHETTLAREKADHDFALQKQKNDNELSAKVEASQPGIEDAIKRHFEKHSTPKKKRVTVERDANGDMVGAMMEDA